MKYLYKDFDIVVRYESQKLMDSFTQNLAYTFTILQKDNHNKEKENCPLQTRQPAFFQKVQGETSIYCIKLLLNTMQNLKHFR